MSTIKVNNIVPNSGTYVSGAFSGTFSGSILSTRLDNLESFSSSLDAAFVTDSQLTSLSASLATRINAATNEQDLSELATKVELNTFTASYSEDSASFADRIDNVGGGGGTATDISALNAFTASAATTGSNVFTGSQYVSGGLFVQEYSKFGKSGLGKAIDVFGDVSLTGSVTTQVTGIGGFIGNYYRQWDAFGTQNGDGNASIGYFVNNFDLLERRLRLTSDADIQLNSGFGKKIQMPRIANSNPFGQPSESKLELSGSLAISSSFTQNWYLPKISVYNPDASNAVTLELNKYDTGVGGYYNFIIRNNGDTANGTWISNGGLPIKIMTNTIQLSGQNGEAGITNVIGELNITGSTLSVKKSTDSDTFFKVDADSKRLELTQGNGEIPGEFYLALSGSTAFSPRPDKTMFYGSRGFIFRTPSGIVSEFTNNLTTLTGSLFVSASALNYVNFNTPRLTVSNGELGGSSRLESTRPNNNFDIYTFNASTGTWMTSDNKVKIMTPVTQLSQINDDPGIVNVIGALNVTGSMGISGSIIPAIGSSSTSSFSLGSATNAWKDIWVSQGTIRFLDGAGIQQGTLSTSADGIETSGDIFVNSNVRVGKGPGNNGLNTAVGMGALQSNTSGSNNTAFGGSALSSNTTGELNTAIGLSSMAFNSTGYYNTAVGQGSLSSNNGIANTAVGVRAGSGNVDANNSTLMGYEALRNVTTGDGNVAIGYQAGYHASGSSNQNVYLGYQAGPTASITENFKLYIDYGQTDKPLIGGDFQQREVKVNGMLNVTTFLTLPPQHPLPVNPSPTLGSMAVSGSALYFYNGSAWKEVSLVP